MDPAANRAFEWLDLWKRQHYGALTMGRLFRVARSVGVSFVIALHDDVVEGIEKLHRRLVGRKDIVFHVFEFRSQRDRSLEATTTPIRMTMQPFQNETHSRSIAVSSEYRKLSIHISLDGRKDEQQNGARCPGLGLGRHQMSISKHELWRFNHIRTCTYEYM